MYEEESDTDDVLSVLACTQKLIDSNERVLANIDGQQRDYKAAIDELRDKQEQVMTLLNEIKASSPNTRLRGSSSKAYINREVSNRCRSREGCDISPTRDQVRRPVFSLLSKFVAV